jgi:LPXTG-site transpeptidase (sortase) family protein
MVKKLITLSMVITILVIGQQSHTVLAQDTRLATIVIPSIGVEAPVVNAPFSRALETWDVSHLDMTVGHLEDMPWFGSGGNVPLGAHSVDSTGSPEVFYNLDAVQLGDEIIITEGNTAYHYIVLETRIVHETDLSILEDRSTETLTLFTCQTGSYDSTTNEYSRRYVVIAVLITETSL